MKTNQTLLDLMDIDLQKIDIKLDYLDLGLEPIHDIKLNPMRVTLKTIPINLDNTLFERLEVISLEDLGGLV